MTAAEATVDALMAHGVRIVGNYHGNELGIYDQLIGNADLSRDQNYKIFAPPFWLHENVGYLYTGADDSTATLLGNQLKLSAPMTRYFRPASSVSGLVRK